MTSNYTKNQNQVLNLKLKELQKALPVFTEDFFRGISDITQIKTRIAYAFDLISFFYFLYHNYDDFFDIRKNERGFTVDDLDKIKAIDIEKYSEYLNMY